MNTASWFLLGAVVASALGFTVHVWIVIGLAERRTLWRALATLLFPPLAPAWAMTTQMKVRALLWMLAVFAYVVLVTTAHAVTR